MQEQARLPRSSCIWYKKSLSVRRGFSAVHCSSDSTEPVSLLAWASMAWEERVRMLDLANSTVALAMSASRMTDSLACSFSEVTVRFSRVASSLPAWPPGGSGPPGASGWHCPACPDPLSPRSPGTFPCLPGWLRCS